MIMSGSLLKKPIQISFQRFSTKNVDDKLTGDYLNKRIMKKSNLEEESKRILS